MNGSLFLFPQSRDDSCDLNSLEQTLQSLDIISDTLSNKKNCRVFKAGESFPRHVIYAGCSPYLKFEPENVSDHAFCHVAIHGPFTQAELITGQNTVKPRCPHCRARLKDWQARIHQPAQACPSCEMELETIELDWRQHAAVGRNFVELRNVFPGEAAPSDRLLNNLKQTTDFKWSYAWAGMKIPSS